MYSIEAFQGVNRIVRTSDGAVIPPDPANRDYVAYLGWIADGNEPAAPPPRVPAAADVRAEAARRIRLALGAATDEAAMLVQVKALERVSSLHDRQLAGEALSQEDQDFLALARSKRAQLEAIRAASNAMEGAPPLDHSNDSRWPPLPAP